MIQSCDGEVVKHVMVQGRMLVEDGRLTVWDEERLLAEVRRSTDRAWARFADYWPENEPVEDVFPAAYEAWEGAPDPTGR